VKIGLVCQDRLNDIPIKRAHGESVAEKQKAADRTCGATCRFHIWLTDFPSSPHSFLNSHPFYLNRSHPSIPHIPKQKAPPADAGGAFAVVPWIERVN